MEIKLNIGGLFGSEEELRDVVRKRKICYDTEPYYVSDKKGEIIQIGFQLNLYATFETGGLPASPDSEEYRQAERDVTRLAEALSSTCRPLHMCETTSVELASVTYSAERKMRPDITVHVPIFDQSSFGHRVDERIRETLKVAIALVESVGVRRSRWTE